MLKGNLSTRPFYNERLATLAIGIIALGVVLLMTYNVTRLLALSAERRELRARIERDQSEAAGIRAQATAVQSTVDRPLLARLAAATGEANDLIDQRTFSWTSFFGVIEKTLPLDVRLVMVSPRVERGVFKVSMNVVARDLSDVALFLDALNKTGQFYDTAPMEQQRRDDGTYSAAIEASYVATAGAAESAQASRTAAQAGRPPR